MKDALRDQRKLHVWLLILAAIFAAYFWLRRSRTAMNALCGGFLLPLERGIGQLCSHTSVSVAEVCVIIAVCALFFYVTWWVRQIAAARQKGRVLYHGVLTILCSVLTVYAGFCLLWGVFYHTDSFQDQSGLTARGGTAQELESLTAYFAREASRTADEVARGEDGCFAVDRREIFTAAQQAYPQLYGEFPFLAMEDTAPKAVACSRILSVMDFTGFYFPFTGEANVNVDSPAAYLPATICHEMAHQRGIASEQECNFLGILASVRSDSAAYRYSGWLTGYLYLSNALYRTDRESWLSIRESLPETVLADLRQNQVYWAQFDGPVQDTVQTVYDGFLKANGDKRGIQSYGTVVDLLLAYYDP